MPDENPKPDQVPPQKPDQAPGKDRRSGGTGSPPPPPPPRDKP